MLKRMLFSIIAISVTAGCSTTTTVTADTKGTTVTTDTKVSGDTKKIYDGDVTTWAKLDANKAVTELGLTIPLKTIENSPTAKDSPNTNVTLQVPNEVKSTTFINHIDIGYNPQGHEPENIYTFPHYDFHLYSISEADVMAIDCKDETLPAAEKLPANYMFLPPPKGQCVPMMGFHASDVTSPELKQDKPEKFTKTMILGFYKGNQNFIEPMITKEYLMGKKDFSSAIAKPAKLGKSTMYPTMFNATYDAASNSYQFVFTKFVSAS